MTHSRHPGARPLSQPGQDQLPLEWLPHGVEPVPRHRVPPLPDDLQRWIARTCAAIVEVAGGRRPAQQLFRVVRPGPLERLQRRARVAPSTGGAVKRVASLRISQPATGVLEVCAVVECAQRFQAVALQVRRIRQTWQVTAIEVR